MAEEDQRAIEHLKSTANRIMLDRRMSHGDRAMMCADAIRTLDELAASRDPSAFLTCPVCGSSEQTAPAGYRYRAAPSPHFMLECDCDSCHAHWQARFAFDGTIGNVGDGTA